MENLPLSPPEKEDNNHREVAVRREEVYFTGPLPPPEILAKYEQVCNGAASRIISMAERQSTHRQELEKAVISSNISNERLGMIFALVITLALCVIGAVLILKDKTIYGFITLVSTVGFQAYNYIEKKRKEREEVEKREEEIEQEKVRLSRR